LIHNEAADANRLKFLRQHQILARELDLLHPTL
jgi:hypothetical protein